MSRTFVVVEINLPKDKINLPKDKINLPKDKINLPKDKINLPVVIRYLHWPHIEVYGESFWLPVPSFVSRFVSWPCFCACSLRGIASCMVGVSVSKVDNK